FQPATDLIVSELAPVGAKYAWRVRACDDSCRCSDWSAVGYLNVGRTRDDINGDGYADIVVRASGDSEAWLDVYYGSGQMNVAADARISQLLTDPRFAGDLNGGGFADLVGVLPSQEPCGASLTGLHVRVVWGDSDPSQAAITDLCSTAGTPSVLFQ